MTEPIAIYSGLMRMQIDRLNSLAENTGNANSVGYLQESNHIDPNKFISLLQGEKYSGGYKSTHSNQEYNNKKSDSANYLKGQDEISGAVTRSFVG